jgi:hypothetical protein
LDAHLFTDAFIESKIDIFLVNSEENGTMILGLDKFLSKILELGIVLNIYCLSSTVKCEVLSSGVKERNLRCRRNL